MKINSIEGNRFRLDGGSMFGNAPKNMWEKWIAPDSDNCIPLASRAMLIQTATGNILCETGIGNFFNESMAQRFGISEREDSLTKSLGEAGLEPDDIDYVILSHLHFDHAGGLIESYDPAQQKVELRFKKAGYITGKEQFEHARHPHVRDSASYTPGLTEALSASGRLILIESEAPDELKSFISFYKSSGHTPGQLHTIVQGPETKVLFAGDLMPGVPWVNLPITMGYDRYPESLIDDKKEILEKAVEEKWLIFFTHDPVTAAARVEKNDRGKFITAEKHTALSGFSV